MTDYRLYSLGGDGSIGFAEWIRAESDEHAIGEAQRLKPSASRCEIWDQHRLVASLGSDGEYQVAAE